MATEHKVSPLASALVPPPPPPPSPPSSSPPPSLPPRQPSTTSPTALPISTLPTPAPLPSSPESPALLISPSPSSLSRSVVGPVHRQRNTLVEQEQPGLGLPALDGGSSAINVTSDVESDGLGEEPDRSPLDPQIDPSVDDLPDDSFPNPERPSDHTPLLQQPGPQLPENFRRSMKIIKSRGGHETTHEAQLLVDTGSEENLINRALVKHLGLESHRIKSPLGKRMLAKLFFWTQSAKNLKAEKLQSVDGTEVRGQDSKVTIRWSGDNNPSILDPVISFRPRTFTTTHLVVDGCIADVILSWEEARKQGLRTRCAGATGSCPKPPTADKSPEVWNDYDVRKAQRDENRRQGRGYATGQSSHKSTSSGTQSQKHR